MDILVYTKEEKQRRYLCLYAIRRQIDGKSLRSPNNCMNGFLFDEHLPAKIQFAPSLPVRHISILISRPQAR